MDDLTEFGFPEKTAKESNHRPDFLFMGVEAYHATLVAVAANLAMLRVKL